MIDPAMIPDPGSPRADGYFLQLARARLHTLGIHTPEAFAARYDVDVRHLSAFGLLWIVDRTQAERELHLNRMCRAGWRTNRTAGGATAIEGRAA